ncbi:hypothetical protein B0H14DRAFT_3151383 [Mycena olivaceomarginata]|nr:hypothetical protein B0H14DRAFT_3151383 [Mycena olivaceomarginata]
MKWAVHREVNGWNVFVLNCQALTCVFCICGAKMPKNTHCVTPLPHVAATSKRKPNQSVHVNSESLLHIPTTQEITPQTRAPRRRCIRQPLPGRKLHRNRHDILNAHVKPYFLNERLEGRHNVRRHPPVELDINTFERGFRSPGLAIRPVTNRRSASSEIREEKSIESVSNEGQQTAEGSGAGGFQARTDPEEWGYGMMRIDSPVEGELALEGMVPKSSSSVCRKEGKFYWWMQQPRLTATPGFPSSLTIHLQTGPSIASAVNCCQRSSKFDGLKLFPLVEKLHRHIRRENSPLLSSVMSSACPGATRSPAHFAAKLKADTVLTAPSHIFMRIQPLAPPSSTTVSGEPYRLPRRFDNMQARPQGVAS